MNNFLVINKMAPVKTHQETNRRKKSNKHGIISNICHLYLKFTQNEKY
jgi:hypothetical protein